MRVSQRGRPRETSKEVLREEHLQKRRERARKREKETESLA